MITQWHKCYESGWKDIITPESFQHPAKMSYSLLKRILAHAKEQGWLKEGDVIVDPFGGIGSTGILGAYEGYQVVCMELERKFIQLAEGYDCPGLTKKEWLRWFNRFGRNPNICPSCHGHAQAWYEKHSGIIPSKESHHFVGNFELHKDAWVEFGNPFPIILQGDSRRLCEVVEKADCIVSSPPFQGSLTDSPSDSVRKMHGSNMGRCALGDGYGQTPGNLGNLKSGDVDAIISSPPFQQSMVESGDPNYAHKFHGNQKEYGQSKENLGNLKSGDVDCVLSSPPYEGSIQTNGDGIDQLAEEQGDTFWQAAKTIVEQCHQILKPGGHAIWVLKSFVRKKKVVDFPSDWQRLCESVGFKTVCIHHAMLVKEQTHQTLFGHTETKRTERKSFFKRLAESKGSPRIDYEVVLCMSKDA